MKTDPSFNIFRNFAIKGDGNGAASQLGSFSVLSSFTFLYGLLTVAWGVFVRAAKYGDGCGDHWPLCDGNAAPLRGPAARLVEMSHRLSSGLLLLLVLAMVVLAVRSFAKGHPARTFSGLALGMSLFEALIGAVLVKFKLVVENDTALRAFVMGIHVVSTYILIGAIAAAALSVAGTRIPKIKGQGVVASMLTISFIGLAFVGITGSISAFGHQIDPSGDVLEKARLATTFWASKLKPLHPLGSAAIGMVIVLFAGLIQHLRPDPEVRRAGRFVLIMLGVQMLLGLLNIYLRAPIAMQMIHLVVADLNWVSLVVFGYIACGAGIDRVENHPAPAGADESQADHSAKGLVKAYIALTKPRVISLLLVTSVTAQIAATGSLPSFGSFVAVLLGGYMIAGAANTINMVIDRDIDFTMKRTATRPTVTQVISSTHALIFAAILTVLAFGLLWSGGTLLAAVMGLSGLVFYVVVYTMLLKRRTWQNIVIGGAAGAFPPLVGWTAATGELPPLAWYLFGIIFVWTPVHFWALAILLKDDYAAAGVPMLPVVKGEAATVRQIGVYTVATIIVTLLPLLAPQVGWVYGMSAILLNVLLVRSFLKLRAKVERPTASGLFHFSMIYLAVLFVMFALDRVIVL